jgi:hypothetical protein
MGSQAIPFHRVDMFWLEPHSGSGNDFAMDKIFKALRLAFGALLNTKMLGLLLIPPLVAIGGLFILFFVFLGGWGTNMGGLAGGGFLIAALCAAFLFAVGVVNLTFCDAHSSFIFRANDLRGSGKKEGWHRRGQCVECA